MTTSSADAEIVHKNKLRSAMVNIIIRNELQLSCIDKKAGKYMVSSPDDLSTTEDVVGFSLDVVF